MSKRIQRVNKLIKTELSQILLREIDFPKQILVTITRVESSQQLNYASVHISVLPDSQRSRAMQILNYHIYDLQQHLNKRLNLRPIPRIKFVEEKTMIEAGRVEELLEEIDKKNA